MNDMNHVFLIGRLTRDIGADERSFAYVGNGQIARARISIAVNRSKKDGTQWVDEVNYFDVQIWGKTAENLKQYLVKGQQLAIDGTLKQERWQKDGQNMSRVSIDANTVQLLGSKENHTTAAPKFQPKPQQQSEQTSPEDNEFPEDIPF